MSADINPDLVDQLAPETTDTAWEFLCLCLGSRWDPSALEQAQRIVNHNGVDWGTLLGLARSGGVLPLLYYTTRGKAVLPATLEAQLRQDYFEAARRSLLIFQELERVLRTLGQASIPILVLKGAALAETVYGNPAARPMGDIDLLAQERDVPVALRLMQGLGYEVLPPRAYRCEVTLRHGRREQTPIELHWSLFVPFYYQHRISVDWLWETALPVKVGDATGSILGPEAQLLHLCGHLTLHHRNSGAMRTLWLYDVAAVIHELGQQVDWDRLLAQAQACGLVHALQCVLPRVSSLWRIPFPSRVQERLLALPLKRHEKKAVATLTAPHRSAFHLFLRELASLPGWRTRLRFGWRNLFPPAGYLEQIYQVPHPALVPLAYPYRWLRGLSDVLRARAR